MVSYKDKPFGAKEYIDKYTKEFGLPPNANKRSKRAINKFWSQWNKQGVTIPKDYKDFNTAVESPCDLFHQYLDDIITVNSNIENFNRETAHFFIFPWFQFNAGANSLETEEKVILFDSNLMAFLNAITITIVTCVYSHPSNDQVKFYEKFILNRFDEFVQRKVRHRDSNKFTKDFQKIAEVDYDLVHVGANCAVAFTSFILCHELAHFALEHSSGKKKNVQYFLHDGDKVVDVELNDINTLQEYEADNYGYGLFLQLIKNNSDTQRIKLNECYELMPLVFFELIDLVYLFAKKNGIDFYKSDTHPHPLKRKQRLEKIINGKQDLMANEFYEGFMEFSTHLRKNTLQII